MKSYFEYQAGEATSVEVLNLKNNSKAVKPCTTIGLDENRLLISYIKIDRKKASVLIKTSYYNKE